MRWRVGEEEERMRRREEERKKEVGRKIRPTGGRMRDGEGGEMTACQLFLCKDDVIKSINA